VHVSSGRHIAAAASDLWAGGSDSEAFGSIVLKWGARRHVWGQGHAVNVNANPADGLPSPHLFPIQCITLYNTGDGGFYIRLRNFTIVG
jgi:hypothetical protein